MRNSSILLATLFLLQSCNVYNIPATAGEAIAEEEKVKVITTDNQKYIFRRLENKNSRLVGITKSTSSTATKLAGMPAKIEGKFIRFDLSTLEIDKIRLRNESSSTVLSVVTVAASLVVAFFAILFIALSSGGFMENY